MAMHLIVTFKIGNVNMFYQLNKLFAKRIVTNTKENKYVTHNIESSSGIRHNLVLQRYPFPCKSWDIKFSNHKCGLMHHLNCFVASSENKKALSWLLCRKTARSLCFCSLLHLFRLWPPSRQRCDENEAKRVLVQF